MRYPVRSSAIWASLTISLSFLLIFWGCSGGGSSSGPGPESEGAFGKVGVLVTDGPADGYDHIWVTINEVSLLPADGSGDDPAVLFSSEEGYRLDLLKYRDDDFLLTLNENVPAGKYVKLRLRISKAEAETDGDACVEMELKVPSGKIDLNTREAIEVRQGSELFIRLDIDAAKSMWIHPAGGKHIFRPVVFVDILTNTTLPECPAFMSGKVGEIGYTDGTPDSFTLIREVRCLGNMSVKVDEDALVFTENGRTGNVWDIESGQEVTVRGSIRDGFIQASLIMTGNTGFIKGTVRGIADDAGFVLETAWGEEVSVMLDMMTPVLSGCGTPVGTLEADMTVLVAGVHDKAAGKIYAAVVLVRSSEISGTVDSVEEAGDCFNLNVSAEDGARLSLLITAGTRVVVEGHGLLAWNMIPFLGSMNYHVRVVYGHDGSVEVRVSPESVEGSITEIYPHSKTLTVGDNTVHLMLLAKGVDLSGKVDRLVSFTDLKKGNEISCFGFWDSTGNNARFHAFSFIVR